MKPNQFLLGLMIVSFTTFVHAQDALELEADLSFADSEAAIIEAEEAKARADEEKRLRQQAEAEAKHQMNEAKRVEADAKKRIAQLEKEEAVAKAAKEKAELEIQKALKRQEAARNEVAAAEAKLQEAERQRDETLAIKEREIEAHRVLVEQKKQIEETIKKRKAEQISLLKDIDQAKKQVKAMELQTQMALTSEESERRGLQNQLSKQRQELFRMAERVTQLESKLNQAGGPAPVSVKSASNATSRAGAQRVLTVKRTCNIRVRPNTAANVLRQAKPGAKFEVRKLDAKWVQVVGPEHEYMSMVCFQ